MNARRFRGGTGGRRWAHDRRAAGGTAMQGVRYRAGRLSS
ncbi:hypothetical protein C7S16_6154 [Burkholderia thailandensis]|uniref:AraC family transcriptional regulator n=1 Tax=Burkholderia thailandensis TaxID=57975 RepID=A0AAW9CRB9_BURTH|nr:hypothetical protein [Burkholderia thailandensis]MDW9253215.1 hypothetical protein [Burkholderia thailandensis]